MKATISILTFQEAIKKAKCNTLVNSAVIEFTTKGTILIRGNGIESLSSAKKTGDVVIKSAGKVDGSTSFSVSYPTSVQEAGKIAVTNLTDLLSKTEIFEKEDLVALSVHNNQLIMHRELPVLTLTYDLADEKYVPTAWKEQQEVVFGNPAIIKNLKGVSKEFPFTAEVVMDAAQLKAFASIANKINVASIPLQVKDGKFISILKGDGTSILSEIKADKITGEAISVYTSKVLELFNIGFGLATIRFSSGSLISLHYELNNQTADYISVPAKGEQAVPIKVPVSAPVITPVVTADTTITSANI